MRQGRGQMKQMRQQGAKFKDVPTVRVLYNLALTGGQCCLLTIT